jgi:NAD(P)H-flavin reductase
VPGGLLCVASGTGAAPITAVVESMLDWPEQTPVYAFVGGRTRDDIYPVHVLDGLIRARGRNERAKVFGVVSDDPGYAGYRGRVETVVPPLANWAEIGVDVLVAGPDPMIAATVQNLTDVGVPSNKIHFDQYEVAA